MAIMLLAYFVKLQVLLGRWQGALVACKVLHESSALLDKSAAALADLRREAQMLQAMHHPNILDFFGACFDFTPVRYTALGANPILPLLFCVPATTVLTKEAAQMMVVSEVSFPPCHSQETLVPAASTYQACLPKHIFR